MRAVVLAGAGEAELVDLPEPTAAEGEVPLEVEVVALTPLDLAVAAEAPFVPGRGIAARLLEPVPVLGLTAGTLVAIDPARPCGRCPPCRQGRAEGCLEPMVAGTPAHPGGLVRALAAHPSRLVPIPPPLDAERAALLDTLALAEAALSRARAGPHDGLAVFGLGPLGLFVVQHARLFGCRPIFGVDPLPERTETALGLGVDLAAVEPAVVHEATGGTGVSVVVVSAEAGPAAAAAGEILAPGGRLVAIGPGLPPLLPDFARPFRLIRLLHPGRADWTRALALVAAGRLDPEAVVSHRTTFDMAPSLLRRLVHEPGAVLATLVHVRR